MLTSSEGTFPIYQGERRSVRGKPFGYFLILSFSPLKPPRSEYLPACGLDSLESPVFSLYGPVRQRELSSGLVADRDFVSGEGT